MDWFQMGMTVFGGLALFLFGMEQLSVALKATTAGRMKAILGRLTSNRITAAFTGAFVTAIIQSSSVTTVLVVGFISAGLLSATQSIGIIMGANVGTTLTAQIVAFKVTKIALLMVGSGFALQFFARQESLKYYGNTIMGLGLVFFGMSIMSDAMAPLKNYQPFLTAMATMEQPFLAILVAAAFTALVQSSSATTSIVVVMATQGFVTLPAGIALAMGANIGTCITALLAAIGKPREALRAAMVHIIFNILGVLLWLGFISQLADFATWISPSQPQLSGLERLAAESPRQIANANTVFNLANTVLFLGFAGGFAWLVKRLIPDLPPKPEPVIVRTKFLDPEMLQTPSLALARVRMEFGHMGTLIENMLAEIKPGFLDKGRAHLERIEKMDNQVDILFAKILEYLSQVGTQSLSESESREFRGLMSGTDNLESIGDVVKRLVALGYRTFDRKLPISNEMKTVLCNLMYSVTASVVHAIHAVRDQDETAAQKVLAMRTDIEHQIDAVLDHQATKLKAADATRLDLFRVEMEMTESAKQIYTLAKRIARLELPKELAQTKE